jgi:large subunit ribosomal protein L29
MKKKEITALSYAELVSKRAELTKKYMDLRFQLVVGHVDNPLQKRIMRREIATLNTLIRQHDLAGQGNK